MKIKAISIGIICILVLSGFFGILNFEDSSVEAKIYFVGGSGGGNYSSIQKAIDAASEGDTVYVYAGTYKENVYINKTSLKLLGAGSGNTTIDGRGLKDVVRINNDSVTLSGFTIKNCGISRAGIYLNSVKFCVIKNNNISSNGFTGVYLGGASNNTIENNTISFNNETGLAVRSMSSNNLIKNNIIKNNCLVYTGGDRGEVYIHMFSNSNEFSGNLICNNLNYGIIIYSSSNNVITAGKLSNIGSKAIYFITSKTNNNIIYFNDFINNGLHISGGGSTNFLNSSQKISYFYNNTNFSSQLGNYWDDYNGNDVNGDGIGETAYISSAKDSFPLIKPVANYLIIPSTIKVDMNETYSKTKNKTVKIINQNATMNATISGDLTGWINFSDLEFVTIDSGKFKGKGFYTANWNATIESLPYIGTWQGMLYKISKTKRIILKGTLFGDVRGITDGSLTESTKNSGVFDVFNSTMTINQLGSDVIFVQPVLDGIVNYQSQTNSSTQIYILQGLFKGNATGYYNKSLSVVLTHIRILNMTHPNYGQGFSIISYVSTLGAGMGWTYDELTAQNIVSMTGFFTKPIWGIVFGTLDETGVVKQLSLLIIRLEMGLPPMAILDMNVWGPYMLYPGQTVNYFIEFSNSGILSAKNTEIVMILPINTTYNSSTVNGIFNNNTREITWRQNITAKSKTVVSAKVDVEWGLKKGRKLFCNVSIRDYVKNLTLMSDSYNSSILSAKDPNMKYGPEGHVLPGLRLNYTIEFENVGSGIAYGVYFQDTLSEYLDEYTLNIGPVISTTDESVIASKGIYNPDLRTITWFVGEVGPGEGGFANISIKVRTDAVSGTEILNYGTVYFPSVPEVTRTNGIVSTVVINNKPTASAGQNMVVNTLEDIIFDGSGSTDDGTIINYTWEFGDGAVGYGKTLSHSYVDDGIYNVQLTVMDNWEVTDSHEITVQVQNRGPLAALEADQIEVNTNVLVAFSGLSSSDLDGDVVEYLFNFGDETNSGWLQVPITNHSYLDGTETYTATLIVKDDDGKISSNVAEVLITVNNRAPNANLSSDLMEAYTYDDIIFNAESSIDFDGGIDSYYFDFGDGTNSDWISSTSINHQYIDGTKDYTVKLTVKDDDGATDETELSVTILNRAPHSNPGPDQIVDTNQDITFDGSGSTDKDGTIAAYSWDFGDGTSRKGKKVTHSYSDDGEYTVTLIVTDDDEASGTTTSLVIVNNVQPIASFEVKPTDGDVTTTFEFKSTSYDTDGFISQFKWDFGDGSTSELEDPTYMYKTSGTFEVSLLVQDDDGLDSSKFKLEISIINLPPVVMAKSSTDSAKVNEEITFDATDSFDIDGVIMKFTWQFGDSKTAIGQSVKHSYSSEGKYKIKLTVVDDSGNSASTTLAIEIIKYILDTDGDLIPDDIDTDDDNDGMPDTWEQKYGFKTTNPNDALEDFDSDDLNNLDEYQYATDPTNPDTDGEGLLDGEEIKIYKTNATNPDTDGDGINDNLDDDPLTPYKEPKKVKDNILSENIYLTVFIIFVSITILILGIWASIVFRKKRIRNNKPFDSDEYISQIRDEIIQGNNTDPQKPDISDEELWTDLDRKYQNGEISDELYQELDLDRHQ